MTLTLTLDRVIRQHCCGALINLYLYTKFYGDRMKNVEGHIVTLFQVESHVRQKLEQISKIWPKINLDIVL